MIRIGVTMRVALSAGYKETRDAISHAWVPYLTEMGYLPLLIPNTLPDVVEYLKGLDVKALLLTGGNDISPKMYASVSAHTGNDTVCAERDRTEISLLNFAVPNNIPVLGICRGMQLINVYFGGVISQDIALKTGGKVNHVARNHPVRIMHQGVVPTLKEGKLIVNSFHNQGVTLMDIGQGLKPFAISEEDGILEGVVHEKLRIMGIQWHPERESPSRDMDRKIIEGMFKKDFAPTI